MKRSASILLLLVAGLAVSLTRGGEEQSATTPWPPPVAASGTALRDDQRPGRIGQAVPEPAPDAPPPAADDATGIEFHVYRAADRTPVRDARVRLHVSRSNEVLTAVTDGEGIAVFAKRGQEAVYEVSAEGLAKGTGVIYSDNDGSEYVPLHGIASIDGRVVAAGSGQPIVGARVVTANNGASFFFNEDEQQPWHFLEDVSTNADGRFRLSSAPDNAPETDTARFALSVEATGHVPIVTDSRALGSPPWTIQLEPAVRINGVARVPNGPTVPGVAVRASAKRNHRGDGQVRPALTDASGRFAIGGLRAGDAYTLSATSAEYVGELDVVPGGDEALPREILLRRAATLVVHVIDAAEKPVGEAHLGLLGQVRGAASMRAGMTDSSGVAVLTPMAPGAYDLHVNHAHGRVRRFVELPEGARIEITVTVRETWTVRGRVVDDVGAPVTDVEVARRHGDDVKPAADGTFTIEGLGPDRRYVVVQRDLEQLAKIRVDAPTDDLRIVLPRPMVVTLQCQPPPESIYVRSRDAQGRWFGRMVDVDAPRITVAVPLSPSAPTTEIELSIHDHVPVGRAIVGVPGGHVDLGEITFEQGTTISGRVLDKEGRPAFARVHVSSVYGPGSDLVVTDAEGRFTARGLSPGDVDVYLDPNDFAPARVRTSTGGAEPLVVTLARGGLVRVRLEVPEGVDRDGLSIEAFDSTGAAVDSAAPWSLPLGLRLPPGKHRVAVRAEDSQPGDPDLASSEVDVTEGGVHDVVLRVAK